MRKLAPQIVAKLKERAGKRGRSAEEEHRAILREALLGVKEDSKMTFEQYLRAIPDVGNDEDRILPVTGEIAEEWGRLNAQRPLPAADSLMAATANVHRLILATRNAGDLRHVDVRVTNPFEFPSN